MINVIAIVVMSQSQSRWLGDEYEGLIGRKYIEYHHLLPSPFKLCLCHEIGVRYQIYLR